MDIMTEQQTLSIDFWNNLRAVANDHGLVLMNVRRLDDGWTEVVFHNVSPEFELSIDFRVSQEKFKGNPILEVRRFDEDNRPTQFFISPIADVLFGAVYCEF